MTSQCQELKTMLQLAVQADDKKEALLDELRVGTKEHTEQLKVEKE